MQELLIILGQLPSILGPLGALPKYWHDFTRPPHRFAISHNHGLTLRLPGDKSRTINQTGHVSAALSRTSAGEESRGDSGFG